MSEYEVDFSQINPPKIRGSEETYEFLGILNWRDLVDQGVRNFGTIFNLPMDKSWREIEGKQIVVLPNGDKHKQAYFVMVLDSEYLKERIFQNYILTYGLDKKSATSFCESIIDWVVSRERIELERETRVLARKWSELKGGDEEYWFNLLMNANPNPEPEKNGKVEPEVSEATTTTRARGRGSK